MENGLKEICIPYLAYLISNLFQRYFVNNLHFQEGGPIFLYVGGDFMVGSYWLEHGHMHDIAEDLNGFIVGSETRFFGENRPTNDTSTSNLRFLTTEQILADTAHLIEHIKQEDERLTDAKVILVGTMFAGNLATWFRVKYPHHVDGVWSSSSYVEARMNFREYVENIGESMTTFGSDNCYRRTWRAFRTMENLIEGGRSDAVSEMFRLCNPLDASNSLDIEAFNENIVRNIDVGTLFGGADFIHDMCQMITDESITNDLMAFSRWYIYQHQPTGCLQRVFQDAVEFNSDTNWTSVGVFTGRRQYLYLTCTEYGWFMTTDSDNQPFGRSVSLNYYVELCRQVFGEWITEALIARNAERTNAFFGGSQPVITNAFFTNGGLDPHQVINVQNNIGTSVEARTLPRK